MRSDRSELLAYNGETHRFTTIFHAQGNESFDISPLAPNGKTVVFSYQDPNETGMLSIMLLSHDGAINTRQSPLPTAMNNYLWTSVDGTNSNYLQGVLYKTGDSSEGVWETWLLDPYQLKWRSLRDMNKNINEAEKTGFSISPDLTRVLFINKDYQLVLYDLIQNKTLWKYSDYDGISPRLTSPNLSNAIWSQNSEMLALPVTKDKGKTPGIIVLSKDGRIINASYFGDYQQGLNWSKDNQLLSFYENRSLTIDRSTGRVKPIIRMMGLKDGSLRDLCSLNELIEPSQGIATNRIIWSPNQEFLAYSSWSNNEIMQDGIILQKLNDPQIRIIELNMDTMILLGWSQNHWEKARP